ncbi:MAG: SusC/RagA family TonB-linked outer membrane protein [Paludibacter sp.]
MNIKYFILSTFLFFATGMSLPAIAQKNAATGAGNITVAGVVIDESGNPCTGATVILVGNAAKGVTTNIEGKFSIVVPPQSKLKVSYIGFEPQVITDLNNPKIVLKEMSNTLNEVVSVGYGSMKGKNITGAVEVIKAEDLRDLSVSNLSEALIAISPSVHVDMPNTGRPGETASITIRQARDAVALVPTGTNAGGNSYGGDSNPAPLFVIDDFISSEENFNNLDIDEVESITILKDASAAVYGAYGAYGVILVKTKRGKQGTPKISYSTQYGFSDAIKHANMLNAYDYGLIYNAAQASKTGKKESIDPLLGYFQADELEALKNLNYNLLDKYWSPSSTQRHSINVSGGNEKATYFGGISYYTEDGNIGKLDYDRWNYRAGLQAYVAKWFRADLNVSGDASSKDSHMASTGGNGSEEDYLYMLKNPPYVPDEINGYPIYHSGMQNSPSFSNYYNYKSLYDSQNNRLESANSMTIQASLEHQFDWCKPLKGLRLKFTYAKNVNNDKRNDIRMSNTVYRLKNRGGSGSHLYVTDPTLIIDNDPKVDYNETTLEGFRYVDYKNFEKRVLNDGQSSSEGRTMSRADSYQMNLMLTYARDFNDHHLNGSFSVEKSENESEDVSSKGTAPLPFTDGQSASLSDLSVITSTWARSEGGSLSYIGRMNYSYADKYLFQVLFRAQASTKFAPENYWGVFPSLSAGWVMSEEKWFKNVSSFDYLKFRASWGLMGRDNVLPWKWLQLYDYNKYDGSIFGTNPAVLSGRSFQLPEKSGTNPNLHWDKNYMTNFGIDARMLKDRLSITFDAYYNQARDMFDKPSDAQLPGTVGIYAAPENYGAMDTYGAEIQIAWRQRFSKDAYLSLKLGTGYDDNKVLITSWDTNPTFTSKVYGERTDRGLWGYSCMGMFRSYQQIEEYFKKYQISSYLNLTQDRVQPGMLIYEDIRGPKDASGNYTAPNGVIMKMTLLKYLTEPTILTISMGTLTLYISNFQSMQHFRPNGVPTPCISRS